MTGHTDHFRTYAEIDLAGLRHNLRILRGRIGRQCAIMEVLKADAYGHGLQMCSRYAADLVDWFAAATLPEAMGIRLQAPDTPVLILGRLSDEELLTAARHRLAVCLFSLDYAAHANARMEEHGLTLEGHIKLETGMNRLGLRARQGEVQAAVEAAAAVCAMPRLHVSGIYTHFACADSEVPEDIAFSNGQFAAFQQVVGQLRARGIDPGRAHCASTGAILRHPEYCCDMIRTGMLPLGQSVSPQSARALGLAPVMTWYARVAEIRTVPAGESVGYARTYRAARNMQLAILSVGYADGYSTAFANRAEVLIHGKRAPVCGKICMDFTAVDVTEIPNVQIGDLAVLLGRDGGGQIYADELAKLLPGGTNGGITCALSPRVERVYRLPEDWT